MGFRTGTLSRPTFEDAPETVSAWFPQRTRWFKGWTQTWFVHMREPARLRAELGPRSFVIAQVLMVGMIASALVHPVLVGTFLVFLASALMGAPLDGRMPLLFLLDCVNVLGGYGAFLALSFRSMSRRERRGFLKVVVATPLYWMLLSLAAWNALWQLWRRPHHWAKTEHQPARAHSSSR